MGFFNKILTQISGFDEVPLAETSSVTLMRRFDTKYVFNIELLPVILEKIKNNYLVVEVDGVRIQNYENTYFDTSDYYFYRIHHNGMSNRQKVRIRKYVESDLSFFEIKRKNNKKETIKTRLEYNEEDGLLKDHHISILDPEIRNIGESLKQTIKNSFSRITLVNKKAPERVTIDFNISFQNCMLNNTCSKEQLCVIELKRDLESKSYKLAKVLKKMSIYPTGFSKYCVGLICSGAPVKQNLFMHRMQRLQNIEN